MEKEAEDNQVSVDTVVDMENNVIKIREGDEDVPPM